ncbi:hypothetical protein [Parvularcula marina]|uniref:Uncharacterized protein n=1 Tax=Parvularcula marina TaxID=2292771 RepID=A0A371RGI0_9PROT|nr:hypothetical protein [Parvularcula marina]RFB04560.1 hypothetical protein DX908_04240 [Parvularcula marina]
MTLTNRKVAEILTDEIHKWAGDQFARLTVRLVELEERFAELDCAVGTGMKPLPVWDGDAAFSEGDLSKHDGRIFLCLGEVNDPDAEPGTEKGARFWQQVS